MGVMCINLEILREDQWQEVIPIIKESFCTGEPVILACHATAEEVLPFLVQGIKEWVGSGFSVAARDQSGNIVGVVLSKIITKHSPKTFSSLHEFKKSENIQLFKQVFEDFEEKIDAFKDDPNITQVLEVCLLTVSEEYRGKGLAARLARKSEALGQSAGCQRGLVQATHHATQTIFKKLGYNTDYVLPYRDFKINSKQVLDVAATQGSDTAAVMTKDFYGL